MYPFDVPRQHKNTRRDRNHDYHSRCFYMITLSKAPGILNFSSLRGSLDNPEFPPQVSFLPVGRAIKYEIKRIQEIYPKIFIPNYVIKPDHIHFLVYVKARIEQHLGIIIRHFKTNCYHRYRGGEALHEQPGVTPTSLFTKNFGVLVSPFIHPQEKAWISNALEGDGKIIKIENNGFR